MHEKSARDLLEEAKECGIELKIKKLTTAADAQRAPSGFGVYSLIHDGEVLQDHYVSRGRFKNTLKDRLPEPNKVKGDEPES
jgi:hypothetical protein